MKHLVGNIKTRRLAYLEQACQRYAIMAYEVLRRELAIGFKSVTYSYNGSVDNPATGVFTAMLIPWEQTDKYHHGHRSTEISFAVCALPEADQWALSQGKMKDLNTGMVATIRFAHESFGRIAISIPAWDEIRYASSADHSLAAVTPLHKEPWGNLYDSICI